MQTDFERRPELIDSISAASSALRPSSLLRHQQPTACPARPQTTAQRHQTISLPSGHNTEKQPAAIRNILIATTRAARLMIQYQSFIAAAPRKFSCYRLCKLSGIPRCRPATLNNRLTKHHPRWRRETASRKESGRIRIRRLPSHGSCAARHAGFALPETLRELPT